jgi:hypothetical protein
MTVFASDRGNGGKGRGGGKKQPCENPFHFQFLPIAN